MIRGAVVASAICSLLGATVPSCGVSDAASDQDATTLHIDFEAPDTPASMTSASGRRIDGFLIRNAVAGTGTLRTVPGAAGGAAARLPAIDEASGSARSILLITDTQIPDRLSPGSNDFRFGADVYLDAASELPEADNGDNILQRGLFTDSVQYKLQIDHGIPSCRVQGTGGSIFIDGDAIPRMTWVRVECARKGVNASLTVTSVGSGDTRSWLVSGTTGDVSFAEQTPLSMGGKADASGRAILHNSDQFNGALDNAFFDVG